MLNRLPSVIRGMPLFHRDKNSAASRANFPICSQCPFDGRAVVRQINNLRGEEHEIIRRCWPDQFDCILRCDCAWRVIVVCILHEMIGGRPIAMAIEQCADDAAIQNSLERFVFFLRFPLRDHFAVFRKTPDM